MARSTRTHIPTDLADLIAIAMINAEAANAIIAGIKISQTTNALTHDPIARSQKHRVVIADQQGRKQKISASGGHTSRKGAVVPTRFNAALALDMTRHPIKDSGSLREGATLESQHCLNDFGTIVPTKVEP